MPGKRKRRNENNTSSLRTKNSHSKKHSSSKSLKTVTECSYQVSEGEEASESEYEIDFIEGHRFVKKGD
jgi:hypothetical protein